MEFAKLAELIFQEAKFKLEKHKGLSIFARERSKFEGWLKVELCDSLARYFKDVAPERDRIDITFLDWAIELKTVNTNYTFANCKNKTRTITKNVQAVIEDIEKLKPIKYTNKAVLFVVFPAIHTHADWQDHLSKISCNLSE